MKFKINIFEQNIHLITNEKKFQKIIDKSEYCLDISEHTGCCLSIDNNIYIGHFTNRDDILVHECTHASLFIMDNISENVTSDSELQPYLIQTLFRECKKLLLNAK